jgi:hypothetical protein
VKVFTSAEHLKLQSSPRLSAGEEIQ